MDDAPSHAVPVEYPKAASSSSTEAHRASLPIPRKQNKKAGNSSKRKQHRRKRKFLEFVDKEVLEEENEEMRVLCLFTMLSKTFQAVADTLCNIASKQTPFFDSNFSNLINDFIVKSDNIFSTLNKKFY